VGLEKMSVHPHPRPSKWLFELGLALVSAGAVVLLFVAYELIGTNFAEQASQAQLSRQFKAEVSEPVVVGAAPVREGRGQAAVTSGTGRRAGQTKGARRQSRQTLPLYVAPPVPPVGGALDHMVIPAIGLDRYVVQGVGEAELQMGPGHYPGTPLPGQLGNVAIAGHRTTFGAPFFRLNELRPGDYVYLTDTRGVTWAYKVKEQWVVAPTDVAVVSPTPDAELTLTTCTPRFWATSRLVVRAVLAGVVPRGAKLLGALPASGGLHLAEAVLPARGTDGVARYEAQREARHAPGAVPGPKAQAKGPAGAASASDAAELPTVGPRTPELAPPASGGPKADAALAAWGALALALWVGARLFASRRRRWAKFGALFVGALVTLVPLWFAFGEVVKLLPANY
jgi:sortase A